MAIAASVDMTDHSAVPEFIKPLAKESDKDNESASIKKPSAQKVLIYIVFLIDDKVHHAFFS